MKQLKQFLSYWLYPILGGLAGIAYVILDEGILDDLSKTSDIGLILHELVDSIFPILLGISVGTGIFFLKRQARLNRRLSLKNDQLQKDLLFNTLISQILHEIRNPLHNVSAVLEDHKGPLSDEQQEVIRRNLEKINELKKQYGKWDTLLDQMDPHEKFLFKPWFEHFFEDKIALELRELGISFSKNIGDLKIQMHPTLMDQALLSLFSNALQALEKDSSQKKMISLTAEACRTEPSKVVLKISNTGRLFPDEVLSAQGKKPLESRHGLGLGLLLLNKILEQAGGTMKLSNESGLATVVLTLRGEKL